MSVTSASSLTSGSVSISAISAHDTPAVDSIIKKAEDEAEVQSHVKRAKVTVIFSESLSAEPSSMSSLSSTGATSVYAREAEVPTPVLEVFEDDLEPKAPKQQVISWTPRKVPLTLEETLAKMRKNARKAVEEHILSATNKDKEDGSSEASHYATLQEIEQSQKQALTNVPLQFEESEATFDCPRYRDNMEDAHFYVQIPGGKVAGICDGHGASCSANVDVANFIAKEFPARFAKALETVSTHRAFEVVIDKLHNDIWTHDEWAHEGATFVVGFLHDDGVIEVATVGDSEVYLYRKIGSVFKVIPLSTLRNWSSKKDAKQASIGLNNPEIAEEWPKITGQAAKQLRAGGAGRWAPSLNTSRSIGDRTEVERYPHISHKPKISRFDKAAPGDIFVFGCDGFWDYAKQSDVVALLGESFAAKDLAQKLVDSVKEKTLDNVSVIALRVAAGTVHAPVVSSGGAQSSQSALTSASSSSVQSSAASSVSSQSHAAAT